MKTIMRSLSTGDPFPSERWLATLLCLLHFTIACTPFAQGEGMAVNAAPTAAAQADAVRKYPPLGIAGSVFNREFLARVQRARVEQPELFQSPDWPTTMADTVARALPPSASKAPSVTSQQIQLRGRTAIAPDGVPPKVLQAIVAGNALQTRSYKYGGGRDTLEDWGYDCSGSVSYVLIKAGLLDEPRTSRSFATFGEAGPGRWITIYAAPGHVFITLCGLRLDTGGRGGVGEKGPRWSPYPRPSDGYTLRHPPNL
jgi:hypothetical protein